ncbi:PAS domain S-box protein [Oleomonas cavernae]|uniref:PAS domain S-box protein n=1 Tax=Oleomonas cavernae TaxID=2320859 RepID=A0A418WCP8_9PROT|nr:PAS domain S-box protein [Oleomonas cavernae]RJF87803.1 PAS domain S-box protein [Oleomonas cavernae]
MTTGLRLRVVLLALAAVVPLLALLFAGSVADRRLALDAARSRVAELAARGAGEQAEVLRDTRLLLGLLATMPAVAEAVPGTCHETLKAIAGARPQFATMGVIGIDRTLLCHSLITEQRPGFGTELFTRVTAPDAPGFVVGGLVMSKTTGKPTIVAASPLPLPGGTGMIFISINLEWLSQLAGQAIDSPDQTVLVMEPQSGAVLARSPDSARWVGRTVPDEALARLLAAQPQGGIARIRDLDGVERIFGFAPLPDGFSGAVLAVGLSRAAVLAGADQRMMIGLGLALAVSLGATILAWWLGDRFLVRPIAALGRAARRFGGGDFTARANLSSWHAAELLALDRTLADMAGALAAAQEKLSDSEARYRLLAENSTDMIFRLDLDFVRRYVSPASREILGYAPEELMGIRPVNQVHPDDAARVEAVFRQVAAGRDRASVANRIRHRDGRWIWVEAELRLVRDPVTGQPAALLGALRDISDRKAAEAALKDSEERYRLLADNATDMIMRLGTDFHCFYVSPAIRDLLGYDPVDIEGTDLRAILCPDDLPAIEAVLASPDADHGRASVRCRGRRVDGSYVWVEANVRRLAEGQGYLAVVRDITRAKAAEAQIAEANDRLAKANQMLEAWALEDALTGLANRRHFDGALDREFRRAIRAGNSLALIMIDVDYFKAYNDYYGHPAGDTCLRAVSQCVLRMIERPGDIAARYGGEEIVVLLPGTDAMGAQAVAEKIRLAVRELAIRHGGDPSGFLAVSAGVAAMLPLKGQHRSSDLVGQADRALYAAKLAGRNRIVVDSVDDEPAKGDLFG